MRRRPGYLLALLITATAWTTGCSDDPTRPRAGTVVIESEPGALAAPWRLDGPDNFARDGVGDAVLPNLPAGDYTLTWGALASLTAPEPAALTQTLRPNRSLTFTGDYGDLVLVAVPAGTFAMGSPTGEPGRTSNETLHEVTLTTPFRMLPTEVTNQAFTELAQWACDHGHARATEGGIVDILDGGATLLMELGADNGKITFSDGVLSCSDPGHPVQWANWCGAAAYCDWLNLARGLPRTYDHANWECRAGSPYHAAGYRLPTEAEWEYACRAGSTEAFTNGPIIFSDLCNPADPNLEAMAWFCGNNNDHPRAVALKQANAWGLYDLHGNLSEWCQDRLAAYAGPQTDPVGPQTGTNRVRRGGYWGSLPQHCRAAYRSSDAQLMARHVTGFRVVISDTR